MRGHVRYEDDLLRAGELCKACDPERLTVVPFGWFDFIFCCSVVVAAIHGLIAFYNWINAHIVWKP